MVYGGAWWRAAVHHGGPPRLWIHYGVRWRWSSQPSVARLSDLPSESADARAAFRDESLVMIEGLLLEKGSAGRAGVVQGQRGSNKVWLWSRRLGRRRGRGRGRDLLPTGVNALRVLKVDQGRAKLGGEGLGD